MRKFDSSHLLALSRRRPTPHADRCSAIPRSIQCCNLISMPDCINSRRFWARHQPASHSPPTVSRPARLRPASLTPFPTRSAVSTPQTAGEGSSAHTATRSLMGFLVRTAEGCPVLAKSAYDSAPKRLRPLGPTAERRSKLAITIGPKYRIQLSADGHQGIGEAGISWSFASPSHLTDRSGD